MSAQAEAWVIEKSQQRGSAYFVLLRIAGYAHEDGGDAFPSINSLSHECRLSERAIRYIINEKLIPSEEIVVIKRSRTESEIEEYGGGRHTYSIPGVVRDGFHTLKPGEARSTRRAGILAAKIAGRGTERLPAKTESLPAKNDALPEKNSGLPAIAVSTEVLSIEEKQGNTENPLSISSTITESQKQNVRTFHCYQCNQDIPLDNRIEHDKECRSAIPKQGRRKNFKERAQEARSFGSNGNYREREQSAPITPIDSVSLTPEMMTFAQELGLDDQEEFEKFRDWYRSHGKNSHDWSATWRQWCRNAVQFADRNNSKREPVVAEIPRLRRG